MEHLSAKEQMLRGELYDANDPELLAERHACRLRCEHFNALSFDDEAGRAAALTELLGSIGEGAVVLAPFQCDYGKLIEIGPRTFVNFGAIVLDSAPVRIGADVQIGPGVQLVCPLHPLAPGERRKGTESALPITIEDGVWLAAGAIVLPGVTVGRDTVVGAGSVVTRSLPPNHLCVGNPCRPLRELPPG